MKYLLDTDHLSILEWESGAEYKAILNRLATCEPADVALSVVTFHEQSLGCNTFISQAKSTAKVVEGYQLFHDMLRRFSVSPVVDFDDRAATVFANLKTARVRVKVMDLRIACTALANDLILVTRNRVDFERVPGLQIEDWTQ